jgi:NhaA family Na+:H+ antiporter
MSLFIAGQAFPVSADFAAAKIAVFAASLLSAVIGVIVLWHAGREIEGAPEPESSELPGELARRTPV